MSALETDIYVRCYALLVVHARKEKEKETSNSFILRTTSDYMLRSKTVFNDLNYCSNCWRWQKTKELSWVELSVLLDRSFQRWSSQPISVPDSFCPGIERAVLNCEQETCTRKTCTRLTDTCARQLAQVSRTNFAWACVAGKYTTVNRWDHANDIFTINNHYYMQFH